MKQKILIPVISATVLALTACHEDDVISSEHVSNINIYADISVTSADNESAVVEARLTNGVSNDHIQLVSGDKLVASTVDATTINLQDNLFGQIDQLADQYKRMTEGHNYTITYYGIEYSFPTEFWYSAEFENITNNQTFYVSLLRPNRADVVNSTVSLPGSFVITAPSNTVQYPRSADIIVNWTTPDSVDVTEIRAITRCNNGNVDTSWSATVSPDNGVYTIPANTLVTTGISGLCSTSINVQRINSGTLATGFGQGGTILGKQSRSIVLTTTD